MKKKTSIKTLSILSVLAIVSTGCGDGDPVPVPAGLERINFIVQVNDGGIPLPGNGVDAAFHADAVNPESGEFINVDEELLLNNGRGTFTYTLATPIEGDEGEEEQAVMDFFTAITVGENGYAEGSVDTSRSQISNDGKTATIYVNFDLSDPHQSSTAALLRELDTRDTGEGRTLLARYQQADGDNNPYQESFGSALRLSTEGERAI